MFKTLVVRIREFFANDEVSDALERLSKVLYYAKKGAEFSNRKEYHNTFKEGKYDDYVSPFRTMLEAKKVFRKNGVDFSYFNITENQLFEAVEFFIDVEIELIIQDCKFEHIADCRSQILRFGDWKSKYFYEFSTTKDLGSKIEHSFIEAINRLIKDEVYELHLSGDQNSFDRNIDASNCSVEELGLDDEVIEEYVHQMIINTAKNMLKSMMMSSNERSVKYYYNNVLDFLEEYNLSFADVETNQFALERILFNGQRSENLRLQKMAS